MPSLFDLNTRLSWLVERLSYKNAAKLLVESDASKNGLYQYYRLTGELIPHPLRLPFLQYDELSRLCLMDRAPRFVFVGSLINRKGAMDAVVAFEKLSICDAMLVLVGDGELNSTIQQFIVEHNLDKQICIMPNLSAEQISIEFLQSQFFLLPSYGDTGPTALKESLASGLYPICYNNSGPADLIRHYGCGKVCETGNVIALAHVMRYCVDNKEKCVQDGLRASRFVRKELAPASVWDKLLEVYDGKTKDDSR